MQLISGVTKQAFLPPPHYGMRLRFITRIIEHFLPSSTRVELCLPMLQSTLGSGCMWKANMSISRFKRLTLRLDHGSGRGHQLDHLQQCVFLRALDWPFHQSTIHPAQAVSVLIDASPDREGICGLTHMRYSYIHVCICKCNTVVVQACLPVCRLYSRTTAVRRGFGRPVSRGRPFRTLKSYLVQCVVVPTDSACVEWPLYPAKPR